VIGDQEPSDPVDGVLITDHRSPITDPRDGVLITDHRSPITAPPAQVRTGEYASRGDYHRIPDPDWDYYPTYIAKLEAVRAWLAALPRDTRVLDAGCGEGVLVDEFASTLAIEGLDANYSSSRVRAGSVLSLPYDDGSFERALCLDVLEHLTYEQQSIALGELFRVLTPGGELLVSVPNLAHLQSRVHFLLTGRLIRTASEIKHPGDRPVDEYVRLAQRTGFVLTSRRGIFPTVPVLTRFIRRHPRRLQPVHRWLTRLIPIPGWCFLNLLTLAKPR
jgi:SAM-dependent methyltransferase